MTLTLPTAVTADVTSTTEFAEWSAQAAEVEAAFDAARPPCPPWCDRQCAARHVGDAVEHVSEPVTVPAVSEFVDRPAGAVHLQLSRVDAPGEYDTPLVDLQVHAAGTASGDHAWLSPTHARTLAAALLDAADTAEEVTR